MTEPILDVRIYPMDAVGAMWKDGYNPIIIGSAHNLSYLDQEKEAFLRAKEKIPDGPVTVAHEILPAMGLQWTRDFLADEKEYNPHRTIKGIKPEKSRIEALRSYREELTRLHAAALSMWLLEEGFDVIPLEHEDALEWGKRTDADPVLYAFIEEMYGLGEVAKILRFYKNIDLDCHNLRRMNELRPHIVSAGSAHAVVYDNLLGRDYSSKSIYVPSQNRDFLTRWADAYIAPQEVYLQFHQT